MSMDRTTTAIEKVGGYYNFVTLINRRLKELLPSYGSFQNKMRLTW